MTQKQSARKFVEYWTFQRGSEKVKAGSSGIRFWVKCWD